MAVEDAIRISTNKDSTDWEIGSAQGFNVVKQYLQNNPDIKILDLRFEK